MRRKSAKSRGSKEKEPQVSVVSRAEEPQPPDLRTQRASPTLTRREGPSQEPAARERWQRAWWLAMGMRCGWAAFVRLWCREIPGAGWGNRVFGVAFFSFGRLGPRCRLALIAVRRRRSPMMPAHAQRSPTKSAGRGQARGSVRWLEGSGRGSEGGGHRQRRREPAYAEVSRSVRVVAGKSGDSGQPGGPGRTRKPRRAERQALRGSPGTSRGRKARSTPARATRCRTPRDRP